MCVFAPLLCANAKKGELARENRGATEHVVVPRGTCVKFISSLTNAFAANRSIMRTVTQSWWMGLYKFHPSLWGGPQILKNCRVGAEGWRRPRSPYFSSLLFLTFEETGCLPINQTASDTKSLLRNFLFVSFQLRAQLFRIGETRDKLIKMNCAGSFVDVDTSILQLTASVSLWHDTRTIVAQCFYLYGTPLAKKWHHAAEINEFDSGNKYY